MSLKRNLEPPQSSQNNLPATKSSKKTIHLNFDTLVHVFQYLVDPKWLANAAQVCKVWNQAAYHRCLWRNSVANLADIPVSEETALSLCRRNIRIVKINLEGPKVYLSSKLGNLKEIVGVEVMEIRRLVATINLTEQFPQRFESLRSLSVSHLRDTSITSEGLQRLLSPLVNLIQLHVTWEQDSVFQFRRPRDLGFCYFEYVLFFLPNLRDLEITKFGYCKGFDFSRLSAHDRYPILERLVFHDAHTKTDVGTLTRTISTHFPNLKHLAIRIDGHEWGRSQYSHDFQSLESLRVSSPSYMQWVIAHLSNVCTSKYLTALDFAIQRQHVNSYHDENPTRRLIDEDIELTFTALPGMKMLNVFGQYVTLKPFNCVGSKMRQLEVLVLGTKGFSEESIDKDRFFANLKGQWTQLRSLLGVKFETQDYAHLSNVQYVEGDQEFDLGIGDQETYQWNQDIAKLGIHPDTGSVQKVPVKNYSDEWHTAVGRQFFTLSDSYAFEDSWL